MLTPEDPNTVVLCSIEPVIPNTNDMFKRISIHYSLLVCLNRKQRNNTTKSEMMGVDFSPIGMSKVNVPIVEKMELGGTNVMNAG